MKPFSLLMYFFDLSRARWILFNFFVGIATLSYPAELFEPTYREQVADIDRQIDLLSDERDKYKAAAARHENDGMRWQFNQDYKQEAKRSFERAQYERQMAAKLQERIDVLQAQKAEILKHHPEASNETQRSP